MDSMTIYAVISLSSLGVIASTVLYIASKKFKVIEDPLIDEVDDLLPGANCGGCGLAGCRNFAEEIVKTKDLSLLYCPVGGNDLVKNIAKLLNLVPEEKEAFIAVVRCSGFLTNAPLKTEYDGAVSCAVSHSLFSGEKGCASGCMGLGDCERVCGFDAITIDKERMLAIVDEEKCTGCNICVLACPRDVIELRPKGKKSRRIYVACNNNEKGGVAKKNCKVACIGCGKCVKECVKFNAIEIKDNLAYIDAELCKNCRKCVGVCPTGAILEIGFPAPKALKGVVSKALKGEASPVLRAGTETLPVQQEGE